MATAYQYPKLPPDSIRLLRLQPHRNPNAPIRCTLFDCPLLQTHDQVTFSPYEALSYVWGSTDNPQSIIVRDCPISYDDDDESPATAPAKKVGTLSVTRNLHEALVQLRDRFIDRVLWIDAICINQADLDERSCQVASMARIYAIASRVLVWLGPAGDDGVEEALAKCVVPIARDRSPTRTVRFGSCQSVVSSSISSEAAPSEEESPSSETGNSDSEAENSDSERQTSLWGRLRRDRDDKAFEELEDDLSWLFSIFQRPWFRRIWVLQEVAAARHVLVLCGSVAIDGLALCALVDSFKHAKNSEMWNGLQSGVNLMKKAFQRNGHRGVESLEVLATTPNHPFSLDIAPLAGLLDMYLTRQATDVRDKVYALLGMCSDDVRSSGLTPDYSRPLGKFFDLVCNHLFGMVPISIKTCGDRHVVGMRGPGRVLGHVQHDLRLAQLGAQLGTYQLDIKFKIKGSWSKRGRTWRVRVPTAKQGDVFFIMPGARWPMIGRAVDDSLLIIATMASCDDMEGVDWPGAVTFWFQSVNQKSTWERRGDFWSSDLWLLWDWPGAEPPTSPCSELYNGIFPARDISARWKSLAVTLWAAGCYESAEKAAKAFLKEYQQETKHTKAATKEITDNGQLVTLSDADQGLEMEFEVLVSQLPDCREKRGLLGLWYLKYHLPPICDAEKRLLFATAASPNTRFDEFYPHPRYEEDLLDRAQKMREEHPRQSLPSLRRRNSWHLFQKPPSERPAKRRSASISNGTDRGREGRYGNCFAKDETCFAKDLGEECMIVALARTTHLHSPRDWLWLRLACHRRGQRIHMTARVLKALIECSEYRGRFYVAEVILRILFNAPRDILVGFEELPIDQEMFNAALLHGNNNLIRLWRILLNRRGEQDKALRMEARAQKHIKVLESLERFRKIVDRRRIGNIVRLGYSVGWGTG